MSNTSIDQHPKGQNGSTRMQNGLEQKSHPGRGDEFDSSYMHHTNVNQQTYGMAANTDSYVPNFYGQIAFPYMGGTGTEWSSGGDSIPYMTGYGGEGQQPSYVPEAPLFGHPPPQLGNTPTYYNQPYNFFPANNDFSAWGTQSTGHGAGMPDSTASGFNQQNPTAYNGDYYHSMMPATPHDYLGGSEIVPSGNSSMIGQNAPGAAIPSMGSNTVMSSDDISGKMSSNTSANNGMKMVEQGLQNMGLGVSSIVTDPMKQGQQNVAMQMPGGVGPSVAQSVILPGTSTPLAPSGNGNNVSNAPAPGSNAPKPVSWAAIASKPAKPQPKPKTKPVGPGLPPPIKHNMDIGTWDGSVPQQPKGPMRGSMPGQSNAPQRWSAPRQGGNQAYGSGDGQGNNFSGQDTGSSSPANTASGGNVYNSNNDEIGNAVLDKLKSENEYNPKRLTLDVRNARFFVIKSYSEDDIHRSIKYNIWCSTEHGNKRLDAAFNAQQGRGPVILFFSVNGSGHFCGVAEMLTSIDYSKRAGVWAQDKWKGKFQVKWIYAKDVPNSLLRHIRLENNENKPVTNSRDTQEVPAEKGRQVLKIISNYKHQTSIFDDFSHYERRQVEEENQRAKRSEPVRSRDNMRKGERQNSQPQTYDQSKN